LSARSKRTATRTPSPGTPTSKPSSPSTGQAGARGERTATRTPSPGTPTSKPSSPSTGQAGARGTRTATRTPSPGSSPSTQDDSFVVTLIDDTLIDEVFLDEILPPPVIVQSKSWISFVFKSAVSNKIIKFVAELQPVCDACDINSFWAQSHYNNSDPNQNFVKLHEDVVTHDNAVWSAGTPTALLSLADAKSLMLTLVPAVIPPLEPEIPVTPAQMPNNSWVSISPGVFNLENNRVTGEILFIAQSNFGSDFYNQIINSITQIKSLDGNILTSPKFNNLNFTETERDEKIQINEGAGGQTSVIVELFAWTQQGSPVAISKSFTVNLEDPPQVPAVAGVPSGMFNTIIAGLFMGGVALAFMGGLKGGKKKK